MKTPKKEFSETITRAERQKMITGQVLSSIKSFCLLCANMDGQEAKKCNRESLCLLHPYREGKQPPANTDPAKGVKAHCNSAICSPHKFCKGSCPLFRIRFNKAFRQSKKLTCRKCGSELVLNKNWLTSDMRARHKICRTCRTLVSAKNRRKNAETLQVTDL